MKMYLPPNNQTVGDGGEGVGRETHSLGCCCASLSSQYYSAHHGLALCGKPMRQRWLKLCPVKQRCHCCCPMQKRYKWYLQKVWMMRASEQLRLASPFETFVKGTSCLSSSSPLTVTRGVSDDWGAGVSQGTGLSTLGSKGKEVRIAPLGMSWVKSETRCMLRREKKRKKGNIDPKKNAVMGAHVEITTNLASCGSPCSAPARNENDGSWQSQRTKLFSLWRWTQLILLPQNVHSPSFPPIVIILKV